MSPKTRECENRARCAASLVTLGACILALACLYGVFAPFGARAADMGYEDAPAVEHAKELIAALPADPDAIGEADRARIEEATAAYDALSAADRATLDTEVLDKEQGYGRWLESAQWGLQAATETLDASTDLADGDYSAYITSVSSMGKSTSERSRSWTAVKLVARDGRLMCVIRCDSRSAFKKMRLAGVDYTASVSKAGVPEFEVPMQANANLKFTVDASETSDSIAYEIEVQLDDSVASAAEVATAREIAAQARDGLKASWPAASQKRVRNAAEALSDVAGKRDVKHVELALYEAELASAQKDARDAAGKSTTETKHATEGAGKRTSSTKASGGSGERSGNRAPEEPSSAGDVPAPGAYAPSAESSGGTSSADKSEEPRKRGSSSEKKARALEVNSGGANVPAADAGGGSGDRGSSSGGATVEPNYPLLLGLGLVLLLVLGMVIRSVSFTRAMGAKSGGSGK